MSTYSAYEEMLPITLLEYMLPTDISEASYSQIHTQVFHFANIMTTDPAPITVLPFSKEDNIAACLHGLSLTERTFR